MFIKVENPHEINPQFDKDIMSNLQTEISVDKQVEERVNPLKLTSVVDTMYKPSTKTDIKNPNKVKESNLNENKI